MIPRLPCSELENKSVFKLLRNCPEQCSELAAGPPPVFFEGKALPYGLRPWRGWLACLIILCQSNRKPSPNQSKRDIYVFSVIFHSLPALLKSSQQFTFDGQMLLFIYYRKHPNTLLHLFVIYFTILDRFRTFKNICFEKMWFCHLFSKYDILKRSLNSLSYYYLIFFIKN